jgi:ring-1,2-phenylacetyl-CoA epoxidase subunit PaaC
MRRCWKRIWRLPNMALDLLGQASALYAYAGKRSRARAATRTTGLPAPERDYRNLPAGRARPNRDFAHTMLRQLYFAAFMKPYWRRVAVNSSDETLRGIAGKAAKEMAYHVRHCGEWVIRLGDGTDESARAHATPSSAAPLHGEAVHRSPACGSRGRRHAARSGKPAPEWDETIAWCSTPQSSSCPRSVSAEGRARRPAWRGDGPPAGRAAVHAARLSRPDLRCREPGTLT